ncbi:MAG TPA: phage portal protein [Chloroflexota bacterium]|jgi:hypothetical protein|nr:phage portal protein [Chloroflexota bacterium]
MKNPFRQTNPFADASVADLNAMIEARLREDTLPGSASQPTTEDWYWGRRGGSGSEEDYFWRRLSDNWYQKDVVPSTYLEIHNQVFEAWNANPLANYIVEMGVNFVLGDGIQLTAANRKVQKVIDAFWNDPDNHMDLRIYELCTELSLYGEIFVRFFVNEFNGDVKIITIDPSMVDQIESDPENIEHEIRIHRRPIGPSATIPGQPAMPSPLEQKNFEGVWLSVPDEVMHFAINKVSNAKRGKSDLATLLPWLRRYKDWLIDRVRINKYKAAFLWDITLNGADGRTIENKMQEYSRPPEPGSIVVHNENESWAAVQPKIDAGDVAEDGRAVKLMVAMGAGIPEHYLASGENSNRATATEMALPTVKKFKRRQDYFGHILRAILARAIAEKQARGLLPAGIDTTVSFTFPDIDTDDNLALGQAGFATAQALQIAKANGWVSDETAAMLLFQAMGLDVDAAAEVQAAQAEVEPHATGSPQGRGNRCESQ